MGDIDKDIEYSDIIIKKYSIILAVLTHMGLSVQPSCSHLIHPKHRLLRCTAVTSDHEEPSLGAVQDSKKRATTASPLPLPLLQVPVNMWKKVPHHIGNIKARLRIPLIFFNLLSSLFSSAALSEPPISFTSPSGVSCSPQPSEHPLFFSIYIFLLVAAELIFQHNLVS